jgi:hypothetical protein
MYQWGSLEARKPQSRKAAKPESRIAGKPGSRKLESQEQCIVVTFREDLLSGFEALRLSDFFENRSLARTVVPMRAKRQHVAAKVISGHNMS